MAIDLGRIGRWHAGTVGAAGGLSYATNFGEPFSLLLGGAVMGANFALLRLVVGLLLSPGGRPRRTAWGVAAILLKSGLFLALVVGMFFRLPIEGASFAAGASMLMPAILVETIRSEWA